MTAVTQVASAVRPWVTRARAHLGNYAFNPLLVRELRSWLRGRRPLVLLTGYLVVCLGGMILAALLCQVRSLFRQAPDPASYGRYMFSGLFETQVVLVVLIVLAYSAGAISLEHEKRTFEMLAVTSLSSLEIVAGKALAVCAFAAMLVLTSLPLAALCLLLGGISPGEVFLSYGALLLALPLWAAGCVLCSTLVTRTVTSFVVSLSCLYGLLMGTAMLSIPDSPVCIGLMNPLVASQGYAGFLLLTYHVPAWVAPLLLYPLFAVVCLVAGAEALPLHQPRRSAVLRTLVTVGFFLLCLLVFSSLLDQSARRGGSPFTGATLAGDLRTDLAEGLLAVWLFALVATSVLCSYPPPREAYDRPVRWLLGRVPVRQWLTRDTRVGWRCALVCHGVGVLGILLPLALARHVGMLPGRLDWGTLGRAVFVLALYSLSVLGFSFWISALAFLWRNRRMAFVVALMLFGLLNGLAWCHENDPLAFREARELAHPALLTISPAAAADRALGYTESPYWIREWQDPAYAFALPLAYQVLFVLGGLAYLRRAARKGREEEANK